MTQKTKRTIAGVTAFLMFFVICGTAGASDNFRIGELQANIMMLVEAIIFIACAGYAGAFTDNN